MQNNFIGSNQNLTDLWEQLTEDFYGRGASSKSRDVIANSVAGMYLTAHLVCGYIGNPHAVLRPTMNLPQLADRLRREIEPVVECFQSRAVIETFGHSSLTVADSRWLLALWSLVMEMVTSADDGTKIEVNIGVCQHGYEIEVGHDGAGWMAESNKTLDLEQSLSGRWLSSICPEWAIELPACPLGGYAVQVNIPVSVSRQQAA